MIVQCLEIDEALQLKPLSPESVVEALRHPDARVWLHLQDFETDELETWLDRLGVSGLTRQLCLEARDRPGFYPLKNEIFFVITVMADAEVRQQDVEYVAIVCRENLLLTLHRGPLAGRQQLDELKYSGSYLADRSIAAVVAAVMIELSRSCLQQVTGLKSAIFSLNKRTDLDPDAVELSEILDIRTRLLTIGMVINDQLPALQALNATDRSFFQHEGVREYLRCAFVNLNAAQGAVERLDSKIGDMRSGLEVHAQDKTNHRLAVLTVFSAIFMPLTFFCGIWGMNFEDMPLVKSPVGYLVAIGVMIVVGSSMFLFFRKGGWFD